jgi:hypothetical protein
VEGAQRCDERNESKASECGRCEQRVADTDRCGEYAGGERAERDDASDDGADRADHAPLQTLRDDRLAKARPDDSSDERGEAGGCPARGQKRNRRAARGRRDQHVAEAVNRCRAGCGRVSASKTTEAAGGPVTPAEWKAAIQDSYDGRIDGRYSCAVVKAAVAHPADMTYCGPCVAPRYLRYGINDEPPAGAN